MHRDLEQLSSRRFDIAVVGGGILGAFLSWCASRRGYSVALLEKTDFASGTTAGSGKVLHGGLRYLQGPHVGLLNEAQDEQRAVARLAPRLARPLQFLVPPERDTAARRLRLRSAAVVWSAYRSMFGNDLDLGATKYATANDRPDLTSWLERLGRGGGLLYGDVQIRSPERLVVGLLHASGTMGAAAANYAEVTGFVRSGRSVTGVEVRDRLSGRRSTVASRFVVNAAGAWTPGLERSVGTDHLSRTRFARGAHVVLDRPEPEVALAVPVPDRSAHGRVREPGTRRIFLMPWEGRTLVGATYEPLMGTPDDCMPEQEEIRGLLSVADDQWPGLELDACRPLFAYAGLYPHFEADTCPDDGFAASLHPCIIDHEARDEVPGVLSVMSVKLTTARSLATEVVDLIDERLGKLTSAPSSSRRESDALARARPTPLSEPDGISDSLLRDRHRMEALVTATVHEEMAMSLEDLLFRRTWIGQLGKPRTDWLRDIAKFMGRELNWTSERIEREVASLENSYDRRLW